MALQGIGMGAAPRWHVTEILGKTADGAASGISPFYRIRTTDYFKKKAATYKSMMWE